MASLVERADVSLSYEGRILEEDQLAEIIQAELQEIGLTIKLIQVEPRQYNEIGGKPFAEQPALFMETTRSGNVGEIAVCLHPLPGPECEVNALIVKRGAEALQLFTIAATHTIGDPIALMLDPKLATDADFAALRHVYGFDRLVWERDRGIAGESAGPDCQLIGLSRHRPRSQSSASMPPSLDLSMPQMVQCS